MKIDRYSKDYRLIDSVDARGRLRTEMEYIGPRYGFAGSLEAARGAGRRLALLCLLGWCAFLASLLLPSRASHALYAALPCVFAAIPLWLLSTAAWSALRVKEPFTRREAERFTLRLPAASAFLAVLSGFALLGGALRLILTEDAPLTGDWLFLAGCALCLGCGLLCGKERAVLDCVVR